MPALHYLDLFIGSNLSGYLLYLIHLLVLLIVV
jgi:hypothetical protein